MKKAIIIGVACLTAVTGLAGCGANSSTTPTTTTTSEIMTTATTVTTEVSTTTTTVAPTTTTTTEAPTKTTATETPAATTTTAQTEEWMGKFADATVMPKQNPEEVWSDTVHIEVRLDNGIHIYLPTLFDNVDEIEFGNIGYSIWALDMVDHSSLGYDAGGYYPYEKTDRSPGMISVSTDAVVVAVHDSLIEVGTGSNNSLPSDTEIHKYREFANKDGNVYYIDFAPFYIGPDDGYSEWQTSEGYEEYATVSLDYYNKFGDKIVNSAWVE